MSGERFTRIRCLVLGAATLLASGSALAGAWWLLGSGPAGTGEEVLVQGCTALGALAVTLLAGCVLAGVGDAWRGRAPATGVGVRRWAAVACGVGVGLSLALGAPTAHADTEDLRELESLSGLPLPEQPDDATPAPPPSRPLPPQRTGAGHPNPRPPARPSSTPTSTTAVPPTPTSPSPSNSSPARSRPAQPRRPDVAVPAPQPTEDRVHLVRTGDTLWDLAAAELGPRATTAQIAERWHRWYASNRAAIGPDPDLLLPGTRLVRPPP